MRLPQSRKIESVDTAFDPLKFLELMQLSRECDKREAILFRQGKAKFQLPGAGHETIAAIAYALTKQDIVYPYYRDRTLMLARGTTLQQIALDYFGKKASTSQGRQMASHYCDHEKNMVSCATPTALQCLPAVGNAWGLKLSHKKQVVICCIGDASTRQGEFYEALAFAIQEKLPIVFIVEDNGYGISTPTELMQPYSLDVLSEKHCVKIDGTNTFEVLNAASAAIEQARFEYKPSVLWIKVDRLMSHTSSDDQRAYRSRQDIDDMESRDPIKSLSKFVIDSGVITDMEWSLKCSTIKDHVDKVYQTAEQAEAPDYRAIQKHLFSSTKPKLINSSSQLNQNYNMATAINMSLHELLQKNDKYVLFGEDICDPKGGVFGLTKGLSKKFPNRVFNSPLAEATICGLASGLALAGFFPIFELQFIDFVGTAFNQIVNQIATLRWRSAGSYSCPMVIIAPCGAYLGCGGPWHSQTNEAWFAHAPGIKIAMPSNSNDAADILLTAAHGDDPLLLLLPKNLFFKTNSKPALHNLHQEQAKIVREGNDITVLAWGNCIDIVEEAADELYKHGITPEIVDLRYLTPIDWNTILTSIHKTRRLLVVHEDNRTCSLGQSLIAECVAKPSVWNELLAPPKLVCRDDVHIPYNTHLESLSLPQVHNVTAAINEIMGRS